MLPYCICSTMRACRRVWRGSFAVVAIVTVCILDIDVRSFFCIQAHSQTLRSACIQQGFSVNECHEGLCYLMGTGDLGSTAHGTFPRYRSFRFPDLYMRRAKTLVCLEHLEIFCI